MNYIIPAHNEAENISNVIRSIFYHDLEANICVVNSASSDQTTQLVKGYPVHVLEAPQGYAQALAVGYQYAYQHDWDSLIQLDGDGQHHPMYAKGLHEQLLHADWVIGSRHQTGSFVNWGVQISSWVGTRIFLEKKLKDPSSGYWALNKMMIHRFVALFPVLYTELPLRMELMGNAQICEYPIPMGVREEGVSMNEGWKGIVHGVRMMKYAYRMQKKM